MGFGTLGAQMLSLLALYVVVCVGPGARLGHGSESRRRWLALPPPQTPSRAESSSRKRVSLGSFWLFYRRLMFVHPNKTTT